jgi:hypothetical protein
MRRLILISGIVLLALAVGYAIFTALRTKQVSVDTTPSTTVGTLPDIPDAPAGFPNATPPTDPTIVIPGKKGLVTVNNFYTKAHQITGTDVYFNSSLEYEVMYSRTLNIFTIKLYPTSAATYRSYRAQGEQDLVNALGIDRSEVCRLNVVVEVPPSYIEGSSLTVPTETGFSGCSADALSS